MKIVFSTVSLLLLTALACSDRPRRDADSPAAHVAAAPALLQRSAPDAPSGPLPSLAAADSLLTLYLSRIVERDGFTPNDFADMHSSARACVEEKYGDAVSAYWLARGRVLGYQPVGDTLRARLELLTVAEQEPSSKAAYGSVVSARIRTDTLLLKLIPDSSRRSWQTCGLLSNGRALGGYGLPENTRYEPASTTRAKLLHQIDSIRAHHP